MKWVKLISNLELEKIIMAESIREAQGIFNFFHYMLLQLENFLVNIQFDLNMKLMTNKI